MKASPHPPWYADAPNNEPRADRRDLAGWGWAWRDDWPTPILDRHADRIERLLAATGPLTVRQIARRLGLRPQSVAAALRRHEARFVCDHGWPGRYGLKVVPPVHRTIPPSITLDWRTSAFTVRALAYAAEGRRLPPEDRPLAVDLAARIAALEMNGDVR